jgi:hypothetical protein
MCFDTIKISFPLVDPLLKPRWRLYGLFFFAFFVFLSLPALSQPRFCAFACSFSATLSPHTSAHQRWLHSRIFLHLFNSFRPTAPLWLHGRYFDPYNWYRWPNTTSRFVGETGNDQVSVNLLGRF